MIKGKYDDFEQITRKFIHQRDPENCWSVSYWNIFTEFWERSFKPYHRINNPLKLKDFGKFMKRKGPYGQFPVAEYLEAINDVVSDYGMRLEETFNTETLIPYFPSHNKRVDMNFLMDICRDEYSSFPVIEVNGEWFGFMGLESWSDHALRHVIIILGQDENGDIYFYDPAEIFVLRSSRVHTIPKCINRHRMIQFWKDTPQPRWCSWFIKKEMTLEGFTHD